MAAGVTASAGGAAADLLTDLKSGYILGANPRKQFIAQFVGIFFGTAGHRARLVRDGAGQGRRWKPSTRPPPTCGRRWPTCSPRACTCCRSTAVWAIVIGALLGVALPVAGRLFPKAAPYLPSAMGLGLAWVMPFQNSLSFAIGAVLVAVWNRLQQEGADLYTCRSPRA